MSDASLPSPVQPAGAAATGGTSSNELTTRAECPARESRVLVLRPRDQAAVAALTLVALLFIVAQVLPWDASGRLVEADSRPRGSISFRVDVNTASWPELTLLPRIGETLAQRIVETRAAGPFRSMGDLERRVVGIGPMTAAGLEPFLIPLPGSSTLTALAARRK